jgi:hypothetical protein
MCLYLETRRERNLQDLVAVDSISGSGHTMMFRLRHHHMRVQSPVLDRDLRRTSGRRGRNVPRARPRSCGDFPETAPLPRPPAPLFVGAFRSRPH